MTPHPLSEIIPTFTGRVVRTVGEIMVERPSGFTIQDVIERTWPKEEPVLAHRYVSMAVRRVRRQIEPFGWTIPKARAGRGVKGVYRLVPR
jgi:hypothetical protein